MDNESTTSEQVSVKKVGKFKVPSKKVISLIVGLLVLGGALFFFKSYFVVAMVNGRFVSKAKFVGQMEKIAGQQALDFLIEAKLIEDSVKDVKISDEEIVQEIKNTEEQFVAQGTTLQAILESNKMTEQDLRDRITLQLKLKKLVADTITVTPEEVTKYIKDNKAVAPKGIDQNVFKAQISDGLQRDKFNQEVGKLVDSLKATAKVKYFVNF